MPKFKFSKANTEGAYPTSFDFDDTEIKKDDEIVATDIPDLYDTNVVYPVNDGSTLSYNATSELWEPGDGGGHGACNNQDSNIYVSQNITPGNNVSHDGNFYLYHYYIHNAFDLLEYNCRYIYYNDISIIANLEYDNAYIHIPKLTYMHFKYGHKLSVKFNFTTIKTEFNMFSNLIFRNTDDGGELMDENWNGMSMIRSGDKLYMFGGQYYHYYTHWSRYIRVYDVVGKYWKEVKNVTSPPTGRKYHSTTLYNDKMIIFGGYLETGGASYNAYSWVLGSDDWHQYPNPSTLDLRIYKHTAVVRGDYLYIFGGKNFSNNTTNIFYKLNLVTGTWSEIVNSIKPSPRYNHCAFVKNSKMYIFGGWGIGSTKLDDLWEYDFELNEWVDKSIIFGDQKIVDGYIQWIPGGRVIAMNYSSNAVFFFNIDDYRQSSIFNFGTNTLWKNEGAMHSDIVQTDFDSELYSISSSRVYFSEDIPIFDRYEKTGLIVDSNNSIKSIEDIQGFAIQGFINYWEDRFDLVNVTDDDMILHKTVMYRFGTHSMVFHNNNGTEQLLIFGGGQSSGLHTNSLFIYDIELKQLQFMNTSGSHPDDRSTHTAVMAEGRMYMYGGRGKQTSFPYSSIEYDDFWYYDPVNEWWVEIHGLGDIPPPMKDPSSVYYGGFVYISFVHFLYRYEIATNTWTQLTGCPYSIYNTLMVVNNGFIYVMKDEFWKYDIANDSWSEIVSEPPMPNEFLVLDKNNGVMVNQIIHMYAGGINREYYSTYNTVTNEFVKKPFSAMDSSDDLLYETGDCAIATDGIVAYKLGGTIGSTNTFGNKVIIWNINNIMFDDNAKRINNLQIEDMGNHGSIEISNNSTTRLHKIYGVMM